MAGCSYSAIRPPGDRKMSEQRPRQGLPGSDRAGMGSAAPEVATPLGMGRIRRAMPIIEGTVIRLSVEHLPSGGVYKPVLPWWSHVAASGDVDHCWRMFVRRFDIEHTFHLFKQTLGLDPPSAAGPGCGRPLDLADPDGIHAATFGAALGCQPTTSMGETRCTTTAQHPPESGGCFVTSAPERGPRRLQRNPPGPGRADLRARRTGTAPPATTSAWSWSPTRPTPAQHLTTRAPDRAAQVKNQAENLVDERRRPGQGIAHGGIRKRLGCDDHSLPTAFADHIRI